MDDIILSQARAGCESYLCTLDKSEVTTLTDVIKFNIENADQEFDEGTEIST